MPASCDAASPCRSSSAPGIAYGSIARCSPRRTSMTSGGLPSSSARKVRMSIRAMRSSATRCHQRTATPSTPRPEQIEPAEHTIDDIREHGADRNTEPGPEQGAERVVEQEAAEADAGRARHRNGERRQARNELRQRENAHAEASEKAQIAGHAGIARDGKPARGCHSGGRARTRACRRSARQGCYDYDGCERPKCGKGGKADAGKRLETPAENAPKPAEPMLAETAIAPVKTNVGKAGSGSQRHSSRTLAKTNGRPFWVISSRSMDRTLKKCAEKPE